MQLYASILVQDCLIHPILSCSLFFFTSLDRCIINPYYTR
ncbi:unnamed protein product [Arabidopsis halleri]